MDTNNQTKITAEIEAKYPLTCDRLKELMTEEYELFTRKQFDYGTNNITVGQDLNDPDGRKVALSAIIFRINDKVQRLVNLVIKRGITEAANEPVEDAFRDIALLSKIALIVDSGKWGK